MKKAFKIIGLLLIGFVLGLIAAPSGSTTTETVQEALPEETVVEAEAIEEEAASELEEAAEEQEVEVEPTLVFEDDRAKISFVELGTEGVRFLVENKTSINITIQADSVSVNGFSSNDITMSDDVSPNSKGFVTTRTSELADVGAPEKISGNLRIIDFNGSFETYDATFTDVVIK